MQNIWDNESASFVGPEYAAIDSLDVRKTASIL